MEIVQVVGLYPPHLGGQEVVVEQLAIRQAESHRVTVYTSNLGANGAPSEECRQTAGGRFRVVRQRSALIANIPVMPLLFARLLRHQPRPDVLHVHTGQAMLLEVVARGGPAARHGLHRPPAPAAAARPPGSAGCWCRPTSACCTGAACAARTG